jgi:hypothetical protein
MKDYRLKKQVAIRLTQSDLDRLEALAKRVPIASRNAVARAALRLGLDVLEADPTRLVSERDSGVKRRGQ